VLLRRILRGHYVAGRQTGRVQLGQRAALYCRVSTSDQSCVRQERDLIEFADRAGYEVIGVFKETGSGMRLDRTERHKRHSLRHVGSDAVLVTELSRWGRSTTDLLATLKELEARRVTVPPPARLMRQGQPVTAINPQSIGDHPAAQRFMRNRAAMMLRQLLRRECRTEVHAAWLSRQNEPNYNGKRRLDRLQRRGLQNARYPE
jgi:hypothetical protein